VRRSLPTLLLAAVALSTGGTPTLGDERLPYELAVRIGFGTEPGAVSLADDVAQALLPDLRAQGCFREVHLAAAQGVPEGDVLLDLTLSEIHEELRYEQSLAQRAQPIEPGAAALAYVAVFSLHAVLRLAALPSGTVVRESQFHVAAERRPRTPEDDARAGARIDALRDLTRKARGALCRGSRSKLSRGIEEARRAP
jgi:hypothetical protein